MSETFWEMGSAEEQTAVAEPQPEPQPEQVVEPEQMVEPEQPVAPAPLAVSADDFTALEERIVRAIELVKHERELRAAAEARATQAEAQLLEQSPVVEQLRGEIRALRTERDQVRQRVERLLSQLDALEL